MFLPPESMADWKGDGKKRKPGVSFSGSTVGLITLAFLKVVIATTKQ
jgi:hypothetical protein